MTFGLVISIGSSPHGKLHVCDTWLWACLDGPLTQVQVLVYKPDTLRKTNMEPEKGAFKEDRSL